MCIRDSLYVRTVWAPRENVMSSPRLLDQVRDRLRVKHYSMRTEDTYLQWIRRFIFFHGKKHPREMGGPQVEAFLSRLATAGGIAPARQGCRFRAPRDHGARGVLSPLDRIDPGPAPYK